MARERVQVQGLGDAVPGISPTIQRAGQYSVQVQQAGRNKLMDLADALGEVNPVLQQYTRVADLEAEQFEEELAGKSPEEVQAMLKQTEGELDKQVRRGGMGWLTSPLNQKRKLKAIGALMHDEYERELKSRVENPANADANIDDLINESKDTLRQKYESLGSVFVNDGFEGSIRDTTRRYTLAHDSLSTAQSREELKRAGENILYRASLLSEDGGLSDIPAIDAWWEDNEGGLTPAELFKLRDDVALAHAARGDKEAANAWIDYAAGHLRAGTTKMGQDPESPMDDVFGEYGAEEAVLREKVEALVKQADDKQETEAKDLLTDIAAEAGQVAYALSQGNTYTLEDGTEITSQEQYTAVANERAVNSKNPYAQRQIFSALGEAYASADALTKEENGMALFTLERQTDGGIASILETQTNTLLISPDYASAIESVETGEFIYKQRPEYKAEADALRRKYIDKSLKKAGELASGNYIDADGNEVRNATESQKLNDFRRFNQVIAKEQIQELQSILDAREAEEKARTSLRETVGVDTSYIDPSSTISEKTSAWYEPNNFFDLEQKIKQGNFQEAKSIASQLKTKKYIAGNIAPSPVMELIKKLQSTKTDDLDKSRARKKLLLYKIASEGSNLFNADNIRRGSINIEGVEVPIADKEALRELSKIYPMLSKDRIRRLASGEDQDASDVYNLFNAIYGTSLEYNDKDEIDSSVQDFITNTAALYEKR
jgi:hypothetical protein